MIHVHNFKVLKLITHWRHVVGSANECPCQAEVVMQYTCQSKVPQFDVTTAVQKHIGRLQVSM